MKKLGKLVIDSAKIMQNEEMTQFRGGSSVWSCSYSCTESAGSFLFQSTCPQFDQWCADGECVSFYAQFLTNCVCNCSTYGYS
jgi:hypothetical protein